MPTRKKPGIHGRAGKRLVALAVALGIAATACGADDSAAPGLKDARNAATSAFHGTAAIVDASTRARLTSSWRAGCPVPIEDLRLLTVSHWGFDGAVHRGELVVHEAYADDVLRVFRALFDARFPIERMELVDVYGGNDDRSMAANNTSAFNCREVAGSPGDWSEHAYGRAVDVNPIQNPFVSGTGAISPPAGASYADRSRTAPGMIHEGDVTVRAFATIGWRWGGGWSASKDFQHFSATGR